MFSPLMGEENNQNSFKIRDDAERCLLRGVYSERRFHIIWCNNGIGGFHKKLATFRDPKLPDF